MKYPASLDERNKRDQRMLARSKFREAARAAGASERHAVALAERGFGVDDLIAKAGVSRDLARLLVLGV